MFVECQYSVYGSPAGFSRHEILYNWYPTKGVLLVAVFLICDKAQHMP